MVLEKALVLILTIKPNNSTREAETKQKVNYNTYVELFLY